MKQQQRDTKGKTQTSGAQETVSLYSSTEQQMLIECAKVGDVQYVQH
jgi:hypothetical protein